MKKKILTLILPATAMVMASCGGQPAHQHSFDISKWEISDTEHWHQCSCGEKSDVGAHKDENKDGKCDVCLKDMSQPSPENKELEKFNDLVASIKENHNYTLTINSVVEGLEDQELNCHRYNLNDKAWYHDNSTYFTAEGIIYQKNQGYITFAKNVDYVVPMSLADDYDYETDPRIFASTNSALGISDLTEVIGENLFIGNYVQDETNKALFSTTSIDNRAVAAYLTQYYDYIVTGQLQIDNSMSALVDVDNSTITLELHYTLWYFDEEEIQAPGVITIKLENVGSTSDELLESYIANPSYVFEAPTAWPEDMGDIFASRNNGVVPTLPSNLSYASVFEDILYDGFYYAGIQDLNSGDLRASYGATLLGEGFTKLSEDSYKKVDIDGINSVTYKVIMKYKEPSTLYPNGEMKILYRADKSSGVFASIEDFNSYLASNKYDELVPTLPKEDSCTSITNVKDTTDNVSYCLKINVSDTFKVYIPDYAKASAFANAYAQALINKGYSDTSPFLSMTNYSLEWSTSGSYVGIDFPKTQASYTGYVGIKYVVWKVDEATLRPGAKFNVYASEFIKNGSIDFGGITQATPGSIVSFTITPSAGYEFESASIIGKDTKVTVEGNIGRFTMPLGHAQVYVSFKESTQPVSNPIFASGEHFIVDHFEDIGGNRITSFTYDVENCILVCGHFDSGYTYESASLEGDDSVVCDYWDESGFDVVMIYPSKQLGEYNITIIAKGSSPEPTKYSINVDSSMVNGSITNILVNDVLSNEASVDDFVTFTVSPDENYKIVQNSVKVKTPNGDVVSISLKVGSLNTYMFPMPPFNVTIYAEFEADSPAPSKYSVSKEYDTDAATIALLCDTELEPGEEVSFTVTPKSGYTLNSVFVKDHPEIDVQVQTNPFGKDKYYFTMPAHDVVISASLSSEGSTYNVSFDTVEGVSFTPFGDTEDVEEGQKVQFRISLSEGYTLDGMPFIVDHPEVTVSKNSMLYEFIMPASDVTVSASVIAPAPVKAWHVSVDSSIENGSISVDPEDYNAGEKVTFNVSPDSGYEIESVSVSGGITPTSEGGGAYSFNMPASDVTLSASFVPVSSSHSISTNVTGSGSILSITVNGETGTSAMEGDTILIDAKPSDTDVYRVQSATILTDGGETVEWTKKAGKYQFTMPDDNVTFKIIFEEIPSYSITKDTYKTNISYTSGVSSNSAKPGTIVKFNAIPVGGYVLDESSISITMTETGEIVKYASLLPGSYQFTMPEGGVTISVSSDPVQLDSISVTGAKNTFKVNDEFSTEGLVVTANMNDGSSKKVTPTSIDSSGVDMSKEGTYTVTVSYTEGSITKSDTYDITVSSGEGPVVKFSGVYQNGTSDPYKVLTFNEDGTGSYTYSTNNINFTWSKNGNIITITPEAGYDEDNYGQGKIFFGKDSITVTLSSDESKMTVKMGSNEAFASNKTFNRQ